MFQYQEDPPFDRVYEDRGIYLRALLGEDVDAAVSALRRKGGAFRSRAIRQRSCGSSGGAFIRLERPAEAIENIPSLSDEFRARRSFLPVAASAVPDGW